MKQILSKVKLTRLLLAASLIVATSLFNSCTNDIEFYEKNTPEWLGESIYQQLEQGVESNGTKHSFSTFIRLIDDIEYTEVLKKTGSKTLFVSDDAAFDRFYKSNSWGVTSYEELSLSQKKLLINSAMINNAYLVELMSNTVGPVEGQALRRLTAFSVLDTIPHMLADEMPPNYNWDFYRNKGSMHIVKDKSELQMVHFLQRHMDFKNISSEDYTFMYNGKPRAKDDAHIFGNKIIVRDITCKNGYINILDEVLIPPSNMAEIIRTTPETKVFSRILERFAAPFYDQALTESYKLYKIKEMEKGRILPEIDSLFSKNYFAERGPGPKKLDNDKQIPVDPKNNLQKGYLEYDPGWNNYAMSSQTNPQIDMAAIFAPSDDILNTFFNNGGGKFLIEKYETIDNIPSDVLADLLRNLMKSSFIGSVPSKFGEVLDDGKEPMGIEKSHIVKSYVGTNGVVYVTNVVYAPASYVAVTAPTLVNDNMKIFRYAVKTYGYDAYLLSMDSHYSFIVPWDQTTPANASMGDGMYYVDPVSLIKLQAEIFRFYYDEKKTKVAATAYEYNTLTQEIGDSIRPLADDVIRDRLDDMLDYHIVVGDIEDGKKFYRTKGGGQLKIEGTGPGMKIYGGGDIELAKTPTIEKIYDQTKATNGRGNGKTYVTNTPLYTPYKSVYTILDDSLNAHKFEEFQALVKGSEVYYRDKSFAGMDYNIKFFNTYHYTVYVPNNQAVQAAIAEGLPTWDVVNAITDQELKDSLTNALNNFVRYHFQDNSIYIDNTNTGNNPVAYETAAFTLTGAKSYYRLYSKLTENSLTLYNDAAGKSKAVNVKTDGLYNIMARDYKFNNKDIEKATQIETSSYAVIHEIDNVLLYNKDQIAHMKAIVEAANNSNNIKSNKSRSAK